MTELKLWSVWTHYHNEMFHGFAKTAEDFLEMVSDYMKEEHNMTEEEDYDFSIPDSWTIEKTLINLES